MSNGKTLTLRPGTKRFIAGGRYMTSGEPRRGGIACVYRALDTQNEIYVALKVFRPVSGTDDVVEESFRRETQALSDLKHRNIVQILDSGFDDESGEYYIVMEWIEKDLASICQLKPFGNWGDFFNSSGRQILEALAFAHTHATVHRDIKPSNVLLTSDGIVKVCDFGISKIRNFLEPGVTLAQYASIPYAPPEQDDGTYSYSRDVFGFAALAIATLVDLPPQNHRNLLEALENLSIDESVKRLLRRCLSIESPKDRPQNAAQLLSEFERLQPKEANEFKGTILVSVTTKVRSIVEFDLGLTSEDAIQKFIETDLADAICEHEKGEPKPHPDGTASLGKAVRIYGSRYGYVAVMTPPDGQRLLLVSALDIPPSDMERRRDHSCRTGYRLAFSGISNDESSRNVADLNELLLQFGADHKVQLLKQREQAIYRTWLDLLSAKTELERGRKLRFRYERFEASGSTVRFKLTPGQPVTVLEEQDIRVELPNGDFYLGTAISVVDDVALIQANQRNRVEADAIPESGKFEVDTTKADAALDKQKSALDAVRYGRSVDPLLGDHIINPENVVVPQIQDLDFLQQQIDEDKKDAVRIAMAGPAVMVVQGPPGTGKTTFITELVLQTLRENSEARILLTSQTHVALDNSLERITKESNGLVRAVRIGHEDDERIAASTKALLVDNKLPLLRRSALSQGKEFIEKWATDRSVELGYTRMAMALERHAGLTERVEYVEARVAELRPMLLEEKRKSIEAEELADLDDQLNRFIREKEELSRDLKESLSELRKYEQDKETLKHLAESSAAELRSWADVYAPNTEQGRQLRKLLVAHADWEARFGRSQEFRAALIASSQVVAGTCLGVMGIPGRNEITYDLCIVDEASIATPTEVLVPMSRARRTVLVGDRKQLSPFQDPALRTSGLLERFQLRVEDQKATLFNLLSDGLPVELRKTLTTQHRMLPAIGDLISSCFYKKELKSVERPPVVHLQGVLPRPVTWFSTSTRHNKGSRPAGTSHSNDLEVQLIIRMLAKADFVMKHGKGKGKKISVAVLTGYGEQKKRLRSAIDTKLHEWASFSDIYVNVIDAFQGREADMVIFSVTRSDPAGLGFLREMERINVALSRGKELLAIVGDHQFCQEAEDKSNPLKEVLDYIKGNPETCALEEVME
ncbi:serine/threonine-protein kinase [Polaromonas sp. AER18D-145]|uniref:serine/threonine-protein kinase n=1 Tax=Polaromonas sp. AER18D-145 TaxID=1977060 RepID=UPI000BBBB98E|nr:serine/threonine-protein kinase [Polaromonas sp. AER18D-145]